MTETVTGDAARLRLFFALWPDDATRDVLNRTGKWLHRHWGGRRMHADTLHMTLAFLGSTPVSALDGLHAAVDRVEAARFDLTLDEAGYWPQNRIGWFGPSRSPAGLGALVSALVDAVRAAGVSFDARPHVPHVTLLRNSAGGAPPRCEAVHWPVSDYVLLASVPDAERARYTVLRRWDLMP